MPYENVIAPLLLLLVLLVPVLKWARDWWTMTKVITIAGKEYGLPCTSLASFKAALSDQVDAKKSWLGKELLFKYRDDVLVQLEKEGCWNVASELLGMNPRECRECEVVGSHPSFSSGSRSF
jgi:hypothetical protein